MMRKAKRFSTIVLLVCCLLFNTSPIPVFATSLDQTNDQDAILDLGSTTIEDLGQSSDEIVAVDTSSVAVIDEPVAQTKTVEELVEPSETSLFTEPDDSADNAGGYEEIDVGEEEPPTVVSRKGLVITQVQTRSSQNPQFELIEVRNNSDQIIDITNWRIYYTSASGGLTWDVIKFAPTDSEPGWRLIIEPGQFLVFVSAAFSVDKPDFAYSGQFNQALANNGGNLLIVDENNTVQDGLAWGSSLPIVDRGDPITVPSTGDVVINRIVDSSGWYQDTLSNINDFEITNELKHFYEVGLVSEVFDACLNTEGISGVVPDNWYRDEQSGDCSDIPPKPQNMCRGLIISEIGVNLDQQYIELQNSTDKTLSTEGCRIATDHRSSKPHVLNDTNLNPDQFVLVMIEETTLHINKTTDSTVYLISQDGELEVDQAQYSNLKPETSWSLIDGQWHQTYFRTPGEPNILQIMPDCEKGYFRNLATGRCNLSVIGEETKPCADNQFRNPQTGRCKLITTAESSLTPCREDQFRNPATNRCKSLTASVSSLVPCDNDEFRNPATNRCKKIVSAASTLKPCEPGFERNPATNRCRKSASTLAVSQAGFPVEPIVETSKGFVGWWALGGALSLGLGYAGWEWRHEIIKNIRRIKI